MSLDIRAGLDFHALTLGPRFKPLPNCVSPRELTVLRVSGARSYGPCAAHWFRHKPRNPQLCNGIMFIQIKNFLLLGIGRTI